MDQKVVDLLYLESIPYYREQLEGAIDIMAKLKEEIQELDEEEAIIVKTYDQNQNEIYQHYYDIDEQNMDEIVNELRDKHIIELEEIDQTNQQRDTEIFQCHQQLDELEEELERLRCQEEQNNRKIKDEQELFATIQSHLAELQQDLIDQEIRNKEAKQIVKRKSKQIQKQKQELDEKMLLKQQKQTQKQLLREKNCQTIEEQINQLQHEKEQLKTEIDQLVSTQEEVIQDLERQYNVRLTSEQKQQIMYVIEQEPLIKPASVIHSDISAHIQQRRACCGECTIF